MSLEPRDRIIYALDPDMVAREPRILGAFAPSAGMFAIRGAHTANALALFRAIGTSTDRGVFYDMRIAPEPETARQTVAALPSTVRYATLGAFAGPRVMDAARSGVRMMRGVVGADVRVLASTLPAEMTHQDLVELGILDGANLRAEELEKRLVDFSMRLAIAAQDHGLHGAIVAPRDVSAVRGHCEPDFAVVVQTDPFHPLDAKDRFTLREAIAAGADYVIVDWPFYPRITDTMASSALRIQELNATPEDLVRLGEMLLGEVSQGLAERPTSFAGSADTKTA